MKLIPFELRFAAYGGRMPTDIVQRSDRAAESPSMIGEDLIIAGNVTLNGELHVDGHIQGDVQCGSLVLGETSQIEGNVVADGSSDPWPSHWFSARATGDVAIHVPLLKAGTRRQKPRHGARSNIPWQVELLRPTRYRLANSGRGSAFGEPPPTTERRELRSDAESTKAFIRSLPESRKA